jgi:hypothetical protein
MCIARYIIKLQLALVRRTSSVHLAFSDEASDIGLHSWPAGKILLWLRVVFCERFAP